MPIVISTLACLRGTSAMRCCDRFFMGTVCSSFGGPAHPIYIETIPKRGYRFIAPVSQTADLRNELAEDPLSKPEQRITSGRDAEVEPPGTVPSPLPVETPEAKASTSTPFRQPLVFIGAIALVALAAGVFWFLARKETTNRPVAEQDRK